MKTLALLASLWSATALAHVTVWPRDAAAGAFEKYVVRVPTEGKIAILRKGQPVADPSDFKGIYRLGLPR